MPHLSPLETRYYGTLGFLFGSDVRFDPANRAHFNPRVDGTIEFHVQTEPGFAEMMLVYNDGTAAAVPFTLHARGERFHYWTATLSPDPKADLLFSLALKRADGRAVYFGSTGLTHAVEMPWRFSPARRAPFETPAWMHGAVLYQIFPERFANGDPRLTPAGADPWGSAPRGYGFQGGDLFGIAANLDYLQALGVTALYLNPINVAYSTHKYDAVDFRHVDPGFGGDEALHALVAALHGRNMKLILDASFNHCNPNFFAFQDLLRNGPDSEYTGWFDVYDWPIRVDYRPHEVPEERRRWIPGWIENFETHTNVPVVRRRDAGPMLAPSYNAWYGVISMPQLNQRNPATRAYFLDVARHWIETFAIDGWRMDVVQFVTPDFWTEFRSVVKAANPECYALSEVWGDTTFWLQGDKFDGTMNYLFRDLCLGYFARADLSTAEMVEGLQRMLALYAPQVNAVNQNLLSSHDVPRFLHLAGERPERHMLATLFQFTIPGAPSIYYGDEIGMTGGGDPDNRRAFPWENRPEWNESMLAHTRALANLRQATPALRYGDWHHVWSGSEAFAFIRRYQGERVLVLINRGDRPVVVSLAVETANPQKLYGEGDVDVHNGSLRIRHVPSWRGLICRL